MTTRRNTVLRLLICGDTLTLSACNAENNSKGFLMQKEIVMDVVLFNYFNRPIFDVYLNQKMVGGSASLSNSPYGQNGTVSGVVIPIGPQALTWILDGPSGMMRNGEKITIKNKLILNYSDVPRGIPLHTSHPSLS